MGIHENGDLSVCSTRLNMSQVKDDIIGSVCIILCRVFIAYVNKELCFIFHVIIYDTTDNLT